MAAKLQRNDPKQEGDKEKQSLSIYPSFYYHVDYPLSEREVLASLISKEIDYKQHLPNSSLIENDPYLAGIRRESVVWILKANTHHSFSATTALVAVNYFDGLINTHLFEKSPPWVPRLAAVACLSLAAKMVEDRYPGLSDLQVVVDERCVMFDADTIKKMELLVLTKFEWMMNPITPISFLSHIAKRVESSSNNKEENDRLSKEFLQESVDVLFSVITDWRIMGYAPSILASAIASFVNPSIFGRDKIIISPDDHEPTTFRLLQNQKDKLEKCYKMIEEARGDKGDKAEPKVEMYAMTSKKMEKPISGPIVATEDATSSNEM